MVTVSSDSESDEVQVVGEQRYLFLKWTLFLAEDAPEISLELDAPAPVVKPEVEVMSCVWWTKNQVISRRWPAAEP